jgi:predicted small metal-binding protein
MRELICPACGALVEAGDDDELIERARAHTLDAHDYDIPSEHVRTAAYDVD